MVNDRKSRAPGREAVWYEIAGQLDAVWSEAAAAEVGSEARGVLEGTGLSRGIMSRYVSVLRRLRAIAAEHGVPPGSLMSRGFNATETAVRLHARSPKAGLRALISLREGTTSLAAVRRALAEAPAGNADEALVASQRSKRQRGIEIEQVERALEGAPGKLFGNRTLFRRRPPLFFLRRVGFEAVTPNGATIGAIDVLASEEGQGRESLDASLAQSVLMSTYFRKFWLVFSPGAGEALARRAVEVLAVMGVGAVGIALATAERKLLVLKAPSGGPSPDRTGRYAKVRKELATGSERYLMARPLGGLRR